MEAHQDLNKTLSYRDSVIVTTLRQSPSKAQRNYFEAQAEQSEITISKLQLLISLSVLGGCILIALIIFIFRHKAIIAKNEKDELILCNDILTKQLESAMFKATNINKQTKELQTEFVKMYRRQFEDFVFISNAVLSAETKKVPEIKYKEVYESAKKLIKSIGTNKENQREFEAIIDRKMNGMMSSFRSDFPSLNDIDYRFASYLFAQFDTTLITILFKYPSSHAIYNRKYRLKTMIKNSGCKNKQLYLDIIG